MRMMHKGVVRGWMPMACRDNSININPKKQLTLLTQQGQECVCQCIGLSHQLSQNKRLSQRPVDLHVRPCCGPHLPQMGVATMLH
jgi:hypothetical protein